MADIAASPTVRTAIHSKTAKVGNCTQICKNPTTIWRRSCRIVAFEGVPRWELEDMDNNKDWSVSVFAMHTLREMLWALGRRNGCVTRTTFGLYFSLTMAEQSGCYSPCWQYPDLSLAFCRWCSTRFEAVGFNASIGCGAMPAARLSESAPPGVAGSAAIAPEGRMNLRHAMILTNTPLTSTAGD